MATENGNNRRKEIIIPIPGTNGLVIRGYDFFAVLIAASVGITGITLFNMKQANADDQQARQKEHQAIMQQMVQNAKERKEDAQRQEEQNKAIIYVLSLPQEKRAELNLSKPKALREMERRDSR